MSVITAAAIASRIAAVAAAIVNEIACLPEKPKIRFEIEDGTYGVTFSNNCPALWANYRDEFSRRNVRVLLCDFDRDGMHGECMSEDDIKAVLRDVNDRRLPERLADGIGPARAFDGTLP